MLIHGARKGYSTIPIAAAAQILNGGERAGLKNSQAVQSLSS
jgi:hypothetical protein